MSDEASQNGRTKLQRQVAKREADARARGFIGTWPPERPIVATVEDFRGYLDRLTSCEARAGFVYVLGAACIGFYASLQPEHFSAFARQLVAIVDDEQVAPRTKLRCIQAAVNPLHAGIKLLQKLQGERGTEPRIIAHLQACLTAFLSELDPERMQHLAGELDVRRRSAAACRVLEHAGVGQE